MFLIYLFLISLSNAKSLAFSKEENEHEAPVNDEQILVGLDGKCLESTWQMMSRMKDCFLRPDGSIADMESISACTVRLEETVQKALYHPGVSDPGESQDFFVKPKSEVQSPKRLGLTLKITLVTTTPTPPPHP